MQETKRYYKSSATVKAIQFLGPSNREAVQALLDDDPYGPKGPGHPYRYVIRPTTDFEPDTWHIASEDSGLVWHRLRVGDWVIRDGEKISTSRNFGLREME